MTRLTLITLILACGAACGDDDGGTFDAAAGADSMPPVADAPPGADVAPTPDAPPAPDAAPGTPDGATSTQPPVISQVTWTTPAGCTPGMTSVFTVTITVTDADTAPGALIYSGSVPGCTGMVDTNPDTLTCPNFAPYSGTITVSDPEGGADSQAITINPCANGMAP